MASSDRKIQDGLEHIRQAEKCMKTGFLKWKPDYDGAASEYGKAAVAFKNAKAQDQAIDAYLRQAEVLKANGSAFHAAKALESASLIYKEQKNWSKVMEMVEKAALLYLEHGTPDTAAIALERSAKILEQGDPGKAITMYLRAVDVLEGEEKLHQCAELIGKAGRLFLRLKRYEDALKAIKKEMDFYAQVDNNGMNSKLVMGLVMIHLHEGDYVAADIAFKNSLSYPGVAESEEAQTIQAMLTAWDEGDGDAVAVYLKSPHFRFMENEFTKLARDIKIPGTTKKSAAADSNDPTAGDAGDHEDEFADGLL